MEYRVKVTVIDKKLYPELQAQYCAVPDSGNVRVITWWMSFCSAVMMIGMIIGTWVRVR